MVSSIEPDRVDIRQLCSAEARQHLYGLGGVLLDCVKGGASVGFMESLTLDEAESFFDRVAQGVERGDRILLAAFCGSELVGTVQLLTRMPPNQAHRANIAKLLVLNSARGRGVGRQLMMRAEEVSRLRGKTLLVLDTASGGPAESLYASLGWTRVGVIPKYALYPGGTWCDTVIFWKQLS